MFTKEKMNKIRSRIGGKNEKLGSLFSELSEKLGRIREVERRNGNIYKGVKKGIEETTRHSRANLIPSNKQAPCRKYCIGYAFNKWNSKSKTEPGFRKVATQMIDYWLGCSDVNRGTIILTSAWDEVDFKARFQNSFNNYAQKSDHTVAVVLITPSDLSLQYLR